MNNLPGFLLGGEQLDELIDRWVGQGFLLGREQLDELIDRWVGQGFLLGREQLDELIDRWVGRVSPISHLCRVREGNRKPG